MLALPAAFLAVLLAPQTPLHTFHGDSAGDEFGVSAAFAGDANRDGYADILVGAHWDDNNGTNSGSARLFSGLDGSVIATFNGDAAGDFFGLSVIGLGDINGDGFDDFAVGADGSDVNGAESGLVRVFSGQTGAVLRDIPGIAGQQFGTATAAVLDPLHLALVGSPSSNQARVVSSVNGTTAWTFYGAASGDQFGAAVASGRDLTGDGVPDFAVGAPSEDFLAADEGSVAIFSGADGALVRTLRGLGAGDRFGSSVALIPDSDGDGKAEIVVGAPRADGPGSDAGAVYVFSGASGSLILSRPGEAAGDQFGSSVACVSTLTGNPEPVFAVGARLNDVGGNNAGAAYVYSAISGNQLQVLRGRAAGDWFGGAVAGGGDLDGDGIGDFVVSARLANINGPDSGTVEVYASPLTLHTWYVDASAVLPGNGSFQYPYQDLQNAIDSPTTVDGDTLLVRPGTYFGSFDYHGKEIRIVSTNGPSATVLDGLDLYSVVVMKSFESASAILDGFTVQNGRAHMGNVSGQKFGGGVYILSAAPTIVNCHFMNNSASTGGGAISYNSYGPGSPGPSILKCTFEANRADNGGALSLANGMAIVTDCTFRQNTCRLSHLGNAGAVWCQMPSISISRCDFSNNNDPADPNDVSAVCFSSGGNVLKDCTFDGEIGSYGGALNAHADNVHVSGCMFVNCISTVGSGGAIRVSGQGATIADCGFTGNSAISAAAQSSGGGAVAVAGFQNDAVVENCIITDCLASEGGGIWCEIGSQVHVRSTSMWRNRATAMDAGAAIFGFGTIDKCTIAENIAALGSQCGPIAGAMVVTNSIVWSNVNQGTCAGVSYSWSDVDQAVAGVGCFNIDPLFMNAAVGDLHLTALSPCIDAGDPTTFDPDGSRADMGAYPYDPNYCPPPFSYCTGKTNSCGSVPVISSVGTPSASATTGFTISATGARAGKSGLLMYSPNGQWSAAFQGGTLCIAPQALRRGPPITSTGGTGALCDAVFSIDWAAFANGALGGNPPAYLTSIGQRVNVQWWGRDSQAAGSYLSNAIQYEVCP